MMKRFQNMLPSVRRLSKSQHENINEMVIRMLTLHVHFNLMQFIQGENVPFNVDALQRIVLDVTNGELTTQGTERSNRTVATTGTEKKTTAEIAPEGDQAVEGVSAEENVVYNIDGEELLQLYLLSLLGTMSGLSGGGGGAHMYGSEFVDERNGRPIALCLEALTHLSVAEPQAIYWSYIKSRATLLDLSFDGIVDIAFARLACIARVTRAKDTRPLWNAFDSLSIGDKDTLVEALVSDGLNECAIVYTFLPACLEHAQRNRVVGWHNMLVLLAELMDRVAWLLGSGIQGNTAVEVDLSDLAAFTTAVKSTSVFRTCSERCKFRREDANKVTLLMTYLNWRLIDQLGGQEMSTTQKLRIVLGNQQAMKTNQDLMKTNQDLMKTNQEVLKKSITPQVQSRHAGGANVIQIAEHAI